ncbi:hypothetical protein SDC9_144864 [bioreactor metagenome]|uniref:Uncharacterized protein n=1 Tax=bioreactor metagenome TaxID=1076179 RepID=A0A645E7A2_9ZZZZ
MRVHEFCDIADVLGKHLRQIGHLIAMPVAVVFLFGLRDGPRRDIRRIIQQEIQPGVEMRLPEARKRLQSGGRPLFIL